MDLGRSRRPRQPIGSRPLPRDRAQAAASRRRRDRRSTTARRNPERGRRPVRERGRFDPLVTTAIETVGLRKLYGTTRALDDVNLAVEEGSIFGFLGPNGAGKTTMVRLLTGLAHPSAGTVRILGSSVDAGGAIPRSLGYLPDVPG